MRYPLFYSLLVLFVSLANAAPAKAETALFFAPTRLEIPDTMPVQEIRITNMSEFTKSYNLSLQNIIMNTDGKTARVDSFEYSAKRMVRFVPHHFDIPPGGRQIVRVMARFPESVENGEYHVHLEFLENIQKRSELNKELTPENRARMKAQISYATAIPIIVSKGEVQTEVGMKDLEVITNEKGEPHVSMVLTRQGNGQGNIFLEAEHIAPDNTETKAAVRRSISVYRELAERQNAFRLELIDQSVIQKGGHVRVKLYNRDVSEDEPVDTVLVPVS